MASIRKVGKKWRVEIRKKGVNESKYFDSKMRAKSWAADVEARAGGPETLADALIKYSEEVSPNKKGMRWEQVRLNKLSRYEIAKKRISVIVPRDMADWRDLRLKEVSSASVRRELSLLSAVFQKSIREWGICDSNPIREIDKPKDHRPRTRRISFDEIDRLQLSLGFDGRVETKSHEVAVAFLLAIETAMRLGEIVGISPEEVRLDKRFIHLPDTKTGESRDIPLSTEAVRLMRLVPNGFTVSSGVVSTLFRRACINSEIIGLNFHDTRREALSRLSKKVDVLNLCRISGHKNPKILLSTYYSPDINDLVSLLD